MLPLFLLAATAVGIILLTKCLLRKQANTSTQEISASTKVAIRQTRSESAERLASKLNMKLSSPKIMIAGDKVCPFHLWSGAFDSPPF
jgi:hypothetical protein